ncbi:MAG: hydroxyacid dehydrogenase, partial [Candidatus Jacksonbacteria bacterium]|nr:hydroxyacid dehydrogenase [Candidatus Jacksonbacteria bacterium]
KHSIAVSNVPTYGENTVAEHTFALILSLSRKIFQSYERTEKFTFDTDGLRGFDLKDKTLGIIGCGNIGKHVARMAQGFEMNVVIADPYIKNTAVKKLHAKTVPLSKLLATSDIITLHAPYSPKTHHLLNKKNIKTIKKGAFLINTSRGGLVDTSALVWALNKKILAGAGLDVLEEECVVKEESQILSKNWPKECNLQTVLENHMLVKRDDVIITPHNAFNSTEALERILHTTIENIQAFLKGRPQNRV